MENVFAHGHLHELFVLLEVLQAEATLLLTGHVVGDVGDFRYLISFSDKGRAGLRAENDFLHDVKVDLDHSVSLLLRPLIFSKLAVVANVLSRRSAILSLLVVDVQEADQLNYDNDKEEKDAPGDENQDDSMRQVLIVQIKRFVFPLRVSQLEEPMGAHDSVEQEEHS